MFCLMLTLGSIQYYWTICRKQCYNCHWTRQFINYPIGCIQCTVLDLEKNMLPLSLNMVAYKLIRRSCYWVWFGIICYHYHITWSFINSLDGHGTELDLKYICYHFHRTWLFINSFDGHVTGLDLEKYIAIIKERGCL